MSALTMPTVPYSAAGANGRSQIVKHSVRVNDYRQSWIPNAAITLKSGF
jgi:hypothetical protein